MEKVRIKNKVETDIFYAVINNKFNTHFSLDLLFQSKKSAIFMRNYWNVRTKSNNYEVAKVRIQYVDPDNPFEKGLRLFNI